MSLSSFVCLVWVLIGVSPGVAAAAGDAPNIFFKTSPRIEFLRPFADPIDLSLLITGADGKPVKGGSVAVRLDAPKSGRFFSTDYPWVEGTLLNEMRLPLRQGRAAWKYLFPIRGEYRLAVDFTDSNGTKGSRVFSVHVRENRQKLWMLAGFSLALLLLGFIAGRVFTGTGFSMILLCGAIVILPAAADTHAPGKSGPASPSFEIEPPAVGRPGLVRWIRTGDTPEASSLLSLSILHLEKQKVVFGIDRVAVRNEWSMKFHFPDGAEYRIEAAVQAPGQPSVRSEQVIAVAGVEPPAAASVPTLGYFVGLLGAGLGIGRWSKRRSGSGERKPFNLSEGNSETAPPAGR